MAAYNGWTNYETWAVKLWMDNEEPTYRYWKEAAEEAWAEAKADKPFTRSERARLDLADRLKNAIDEGMPEDISKAVNASMYGDLLNAALSEVNWQEIANSLLEVDIEGYESWEHATARE